MKVETLDIPEGVKQDYLDSGITDLNPPQQEAVSSGLMEGRDMIVASPTASGKTLIAEIGMSKQVIENDKTAIYIVPLKALASEKYQDFDERFENQNVRIAVGDHDDSGESFSNADIVVATSEKLDSLLRHNPSWIHEIGMVVIDEIHLITSPDRGPTLEVTISRLRDILEFQLLGLSATISNSDELAEWLDAELVESRYRPVELKHGIHWDNEIEFYSEETIEEHSIPNTQPEKGGSLEGTEVGGFSTGNEIKEAEETEIESEEVFVEDKHGRGSINIIQDTLEMDKQAIVFCSSRKGAEKSSDRAGKVTEEDLTRSEKAELERYADRIENVLGNPTSQCERLADNVRKGAAFHHAGLCVTGDSIVIHSDGSFSRMENLVENDRKKALGLQNYEIRQNHVHRKYEMGNKPVLKIETSRGRQIKVSKNHQLPVLQEEGIVWRKAKNLLEGKRVATPRRIEIKADTPELRKLLRDEVRTYRKYEEIRELVERIETETLDLYHDRYSEDRNISVGGLREICEKVGENPGRYLDNIMSKGSQKPVKIPEKMDKDLAWLIGAVAGDGYLQKSSINLTGSEEKILDRFRDIIETKFGRTVITTEREKDDVRRFSLNSKAVSDMFHDYFGIPQEEKAHNLRMPEIGMPDNLLASYLRGLFDTDGSVNCRNNSDGASCIEFYTASDDLATELHTSLLRFGIIANRDKRDTKGRTTTVNRREINTNGDLHRILIYGSEQLRKFRDEIGFTHPEKKLRLEKAIEINPSGGRKQNDVIPRSLGTKVRKIRNSNNLSLSDLEPDISRATISRFENHETPIKRETFQKLASKLDDNELEKIGKSEIYWDKIESIEEQKPEKLYDLSTSTDNFIANGIIAHNTTEQRELVEEAFREGLIRTVSATPTLAAGVNLPAYRVVMRDLKRYTGQGMEFIPTLEYEQMSGRAGRPKYDDQGEAISIAKQPGMKDEILERYILGEPERIQSKLAAEPVLRMHTLSLVASGFCTSMEGLLEFYAETLYAHQYGELSEVEQQVKKVVDQLREFEFLEKSGMEATKTGRRVSELYIDPESAHHMIESMKRAEEMENTEALSYLFMACRTTEIRDLRVKDDEYQDIAQTLLDAKKYLLESAPNEWDPEYDQFLESLKTALMLKSWINEKDEEGIMDKYDTAPGGVRAKTRNADWLLYGAKELARMKDIEVQNDLKKLRVRLKHGIQEELLSLVNYDQIGRVRARKLHEHGIRDQEDIREVSFEKLKKLIGKRTAEKLKKQVGEENVFDRENIMDYF